jgi:hypothetical protein
VPPDLERPQHVPGCDAQKSMHCATVGGRSCHAGWVFVNVFHRVDVNAITGTSLARATGNNRHSLFVCAMLYLTIRKSIWHGVESLNSKRKSYFCEDVSKLVNGAVRTFPLSVLSPSPLPTPTPVVSPTTPTKSTSTLSPTSTTADPRSRRSRFTPTHRSCVLHPRNRTAPSMPRLPPGTINAKEKCQSLVMCMCKQSG